MISTAPCCSGCIQYSQKTESGYATNNNYSKDSKACRCGEHSNVQPNHRTIGKTKASKFNSIYKDQSGPFPKQELALNSFACSLMVEYTQLGKTLKGLRLGCGRGGFPCRVEMRCHWMQQDTPCMCMSSHVETCPLFALYYFSFSQRASPLVSLSLPFKPNMAVELSKFNHQYWCMLPPSLASYCNIHQLIFHVSTQAYCSTVRELLELRSIFSLSSLFEL